MNFKHTNASWIAYFLLIFGCFACHPIYKVANFHSHNTKFTANYTKSNSQLDSIIQPYKTVLDKEMNRVLAINENTLNKKTPESDFGNLLADMLFQKAIKYSKHKVDFAVINNGGIRLQQLPKGEVTLGKVYEIMPFDNQIVVVEIDGKTAQELFNDMANGGGWPISGAHYKIQNHKATDIFIAGREINPDETYYVAISDYLANGGDKLDFLVSKKQITTDSLIRDAFIHSFEEIGASQKTVKAAVEGRVTH